MGTRCDTTIIDEKGDIYVILYRTSDGYPEGHGKELAEFLTGAVIGNGIGPEDSDNPKFFNGVGGLALRVLTYFKPENEPGSFYIIPPETDWGQEFSYTVKGVEGFGVNLKVEGYSGALFNGSPEDFLTWVKTIEEED